MYCKNCGAMIDDDARFCPTCGFDQGPRTSYGSTTYGPTGGYQERPVYTAGDRKRTMMVTLIVTLIVSLLFGAVFGLIVFILMVVFYWLMRKSSTEEITGAIIGGIVGLVVGYLINLVVFAAIASMLV